MKKLLLTAALLATTTLGVLAQGTTVWDSTGNTSPSSTASSGGQWWIALNGNAATLLNEDVNATLLGGTVSGSLTPLATLLLSNHTADGDITFLGNGAFLDQSGKEYTVPGSAANGTALLQIQAWTGNFATYAAAVAANTGYYAQTAEFSQALGGAGTPAPGLSSMPAIVLVQNIPEPSTIALAGLGAAALLIFRRRN